MRWDRPGRACSDRICACLGLHSHPVQNMFPSAGCLESPWLPRVTHMAGLGWGCCSLWNHSPKSSSPAGSSPSTSGVTVALCHLFGGRSLHCLLHTFSSKDPATETCLSDRDTLRFTPIDSGLRSQLSSGNENSHCQCRPETRWAQDHPSPCCNSSEPCLMAAVCCLGTVLSCLLQ